jgi:hypothetical protein
MIGWGFAALGQATREKSETTNEIETIAPLLIRYVEKRSTNGNKRAPFSLYGPEIIMRYY